MFKWKHICKAIPEVQLTVVHSWQNKKNTFQAARLVHLSVAYFQLLNYFIFMKFDIGIIYMKISI